MSKRVCVRVERSLLQGVIDRRPTSGMGCGREILPGEDRVPGSSDQQLCDDLIIIIMLWTGLSFNRLLTKTRNGVGWKKLVVRPIIEEDKIHETGQS